MPRSVEWSYAHIAFWSLSPSDSASIHSCLSFPFGGNQLPPSQDISPLLTPGYNSDNKSFQRSCPVGNMDEITPYFASSPCTVFLYYFSRLVPSLWLSCHIQGIQRIPLGSFYRNTSPMHCYMFFSLLFQAFRTERKHPEPLTKK